MAAQSGRSSTPGAGSLVHGAPVTASNGGRRQGNVIGFFFYPPSVGIGGGRARLPPQLGAGADASPRPQHHWRPWVAVRAARFACWMGGYLDPGVGRVFSSCSMFSSVLSLFHHTELTAFSSSKQFFGVFFQNRHYWRVPPGDSHHGESPFAGSVLKKRRKREKKEFLAECH